MGIQRYTLEGHDRECGMDPDDMGTWVEYAPWMDALSGIPDPAALVEAVKRVEQSVGWLHKFLGRENQQPDDGEQWEAIETEIGEALSALRVAMGES